MKFFKSILFMIIFTAGLSSYAGESSNGVQSNAPTLNGLQLNGFTLNGLQLNGLRFNRIEVKGLTQSDRSKRSFRQSSLAKMSRKPLVKVRPMVDQEDE